MPGEVQPSISTNTNQHLPLSTGILVAGVATASVAGGGCSQVAGSFPVRSFRLTGAAPVLAPQPAGPPLGVTHVPRPTRDCKKQDEETLTGNKKNCRTSAIKKSAFLYLWVSRDSRCK